MYVMQRHGGRSCIEGEAEGSNRMTDLKQRRINAGLTQTGLARRAGCSKQWISLVENGGNPGVDLADRIERVLETERLKPASFEVRQCLRDGCSNTVMVNKKYKRRQYCSDACVVKACRMRKKRLMKRGKMRLRGFPFADADEERFFSELWCERYE